MNGMEQREYPGRPLAALHRAQLLAFALSCPLPVAAYLYLRATLPEHASVWTGAPWYAWGSLLPMLVAIVAVWNVTLSRLPCPACKTREVLVRGFQRRAWVLCNRCRIAWKTNISMG